VKKQINSDTISELNDAMRMCIVCRGRFPQKGLYRFQEENKKLVNFQKVGRSFYVCAKCIESEKNRLIKILNHKFKIKYENIEDFGKILKELCTNG
jgi:uncharacterized protein